MSNGDPADSEAGQISSAAMNATVHNFIQPRGGSDRILSRIAPKTC